MKSSAIITKEFLVDSIFPAEWFDDLKRIWNESLFYLSWLQAYNRARLNNALDLPAVEIKTKKIDKDKESVWVSYCPLIKDFRLEKSKSWDKENLHQLQLIRLSDGTFDTYSGLLVCYYARCCLLKMLENRIILYLLTTAKLPKSLTSWTSWDKINDFDFLETFFINSKFLTEPPISEFSSFELKKPFAKKRCEWLKQSTIPATLLNDYIELIVYPAWEAYQKGIRGKPLYKRPHDKVKTIKSASFRGQCKVVDDDKIIFPKLNATKVNGLSKRMLEPIKRLVEDMRINPSQYDSLQVKIKRIKSEEVGRLIKADGKKRKELTQEEIQAYEKRLNSEEIFEKAIDYFAKPGSFSITLREGKTYLQITAEMPITITQTEREVGINTGLDLLVESSTGIKMKHPSFTQDMARLDTLRTKLSAMQAGSKNHQKLSQKIAKISARIARARRGKHDYAAQWLADSYGTIVLKKVKPVEIIENPVPIRSKSGKYLPNGKSEARVKNEELLCCGIGGFGLRLKQQASKRKRQFVEVSLEAEATADEVLFVGSPDHASSAEAHKSLPSGADAREGDKVTVSGTSGKVETPTASNHKLNAIASSQFKKPTNKKTPKPILSEAATPEPSKKRRRNKFREKIIG